jgi:hypothetical protein
MYTKDLERMIRSLVKQRTDPEYIRHYLIETYQLDPKIVVKLFEEMGVGKEKQKFNTKSDPFNAGGNKSPRKPFQ